jgi:hypothetical protein
MMNGREMTFLAGDETLGGKRNFARERERERRPFAVLLERARSADAPGTRKVVFPGRGPHYASPTGPWPPGSEPVCTRCVVIKKGHPTLPGTKVMTVLPLFFDTIPGLGATELRHTFL